MRRSNFSRFRDENVEIKNQERIQKQLKSVVRQGYKQGYINISNRNLKEIPDYVFNPDEVFETENINYDFNRNTDNDDWWDISELKKLNIANNKIEVISPKIGEMETLVHLNFCDNKLTSLPQEIQNLKLVTSIHLERNNFTSIPLPLFELENLVELFLFNNKLCGDLNEYEFYKLSKLEVLDLSENLIENVGDCFSNNKKLRKLQLSHNKIREISSLDLKYCKELELSYNELVTIFTGKQSFPMLQRLDLRNNKLKSIGDNVSCPELKELYLTSNRLSSLGSILKTASHLNILDIFGNVFKEVPEDILYLKDITRLDLGNNDITELPPKLGLLTNIKFLRFEGNMIKGIKATKTSDVLQILKNRIPVNELQDDISDSFDKKVRINTYNQNTNTGTFNNSFDSIIKPPSPKKTYSNPYGTSPKKSNNNSFNNSLNTSNTSSSPKKVNDSPFAISSSYSSSDRKINSRRSYNNQSSLTTDPLGINNFSTNNSYYSSVKSNFNSSPVRKIKFSISEQNKNIKNLDLSSKEINNLEQFDIESLDFEPETINLSKNLFTSVPNILTDFSSSLTTLILDFNKIIVFPERLVLPNLVKLSITHNLINEFPENIDPSQFPKLIELNLSYNNIKKLPSNQIPFPALETLILSKNKIEAIENPEVFGQLSILDLSDNSISYIPPKLGLCTKLKKLSLEGNTFRVPRYQILQKGTASILAYLKDRIPQN